MAEHKRRQRGNEQAVADDQVGEGDYGQQLDDSEEADDSKRKNASKYISITADGRHFEWNSG